MTAADRRVDTELDGVLLRAAVPAGDLAVVCRRAHALGRQVAGCAGDRAAARAPVVTMTTASDARPERAVSGLRRARPRPAVYTPGLRRDPMRELRALQRDPLPSDAEMEGYYRDPRYIDGGYFAAERPTRVRRARSSARPSSSSPGAGWRAGSLVPDGCSTSVPVRVAFLELARRTGGRRWDRTLARAGRTRSSAQRRTRGPRRFRERPCGGRVRLRCLRRGDDVDVLEHTTDPGAVLDRARTLLAPAGVLIVFTIDAASLFNTVADIAWRLTGNRLASPSNCSTTRLQQPLLHGAHAGDAARAARPAHRARRDPPCAPRALAQRTASRAVLLGAEIVDLLSVPLGRPYRQLLYTVPS